MSTIKNLKEFKALINRYETITIEEIKKIDKGIIYKDTKMKLTGFGDYETCTLCIGVSYGPNNMGNCLNCVWGVVLNNFETKGYYRPCYGENKSITQKTMQNIASADSSKKLLTAYRNRAKHMRSILKKLNIEF